MTDTDPTQMPALPPDPPEKSRPTGDRPALPGKVTAAAIILLVFGTLSALGSAFTLLWSLLWIGRMGMGFDRFGDRFNDGFGGGGVGFSGFLFVVLAVGMAAAVAGSQLAAGWGILQRRSWARIVGMVVSGTALVLLILGVLGTLMWVAILPDFREFDRVPEWITNWFRSAMVAGVGFGVLVSLAVGAAYGYVLWVLARADEVFD